MGSTVHAHETTARSLAVAAAPAGTPGFDVSHYQGNVDWTGAVASGAKFVYMKATEGTDYTDPQFTANYANSANAGLARGAYHFALPSDSSGAAQATFFLAHGGGWVADGHTLPPVLDIEYNPYGTADWAGWCYNLNAAQMTAWISDFANTIHARTNRWPAIYTTNGWWSNCTGNDAGFGNDPLWIAPSSSDAGGPPGIPASWSAYTFFQWATSGTFPGDQDVFNGTAADVAAFTIAGTADQIQAHYTAFGGSASSLGNATGGEYPIASGWAQNYQNGIIYYSPDTGAYAVTGAVLTRYQQLGGPGGSLGFPTSDTTTTSDGGQHADFGGTSLYYSPATGTHSVQGQIRTKWLALGGAQALGYPTTDESGTPDGVGRYNHFSSSSGSASIYWTPNTGAHSIQGAIRSKWASLGWETGLGYPITDESVTPDGTGRYNHFSLAAGASIYWTPGTGAHSIQGAIRSKWASMGWERSIGYPTTDENGTPDGVGRYNHFSLAAGASIYWTPGTGAHSIQGAIRSKWSALGWETGLGYPTTDESVTPDGVGRYNHFTGSASIYWTPGTGAWSIYGAIRDTWASLGWETSRLRYPTSDEFGVPGGRRNNFQGGNITWLSANGSTQAAYS
ncbi:GH25 family lysozyme [Amycolatopsis sp. GM8]|uniref:GH25 family lysozyme n=1 Tax=Amycolatopsis sp. GM8 TaxID=2896530 RepID=UPI001F290B0C|nr:GH25 family lysozyme [Amycolatopsis sp. GM8]